MCVRFIISRSQIETRGGRFFKTNSKLISAFSALFRAAFCVLASVPKRSFPFVLEFINDPMRELLISMS